MPTAKQDKTRKNGLTVKDLIVMGVFGALLMVCSMIGGDIICCHSDSYFLFLHRSRFASGASIFTSSCKSAKALGIDNYWGHYFSA